MRLLDGHVFQIINKLEAHESKTLSRWRETAEYRQTNKLWLRHSQRIAVIRKLLLSAKVLTSLYELGLTLLTRYQPFLLPLFLLLN